MIRYAHANRASRSIEEEIAASITCAAVRRFVSPTYSPARTSSCNNTLSLLLSPSANLQSLAGRNNLSETRVQTWSYAPTAIGNATFSSGSAVCCRAHCGDLLPFPLPSPSRNVISIESIRQHIYQTDCERRIPDQILIYNRT